MSHFTQMKTSLTEKDILKKVLKAMKFEVVEEPNGVEVRGYFGDTQKAEFKVLTDTHYDIGFVKGENGGYEIVGDWELLPKVSGIEQQDFLAKVKREYAREAIVETAKSRGYDVECIEAEDGSFEMVVTQW